MKKTSLPAAFSELAGQVSYVQRWTQDEWSSSCPECKGSPHKSGEYPDRFRMWTNANGKNKVMGWCRRCGYVWFPGGGKKLSAEEFEQWRKEQVAIETKKKEEAERAIELLNSEKIWEQYHAALYNFDLAIKTVKEWGIPKSYAEYWMIGFMQDYTVYRKDQEPYHSPAISIPVWRPLGKISNVKVRVLNPKDGGDRYRSLYKTGIARPFVAWRNCPSKNVLVVEGEKKCMTSAVQTRKEGIKVQVYGLPSKTPDEDSIKELRGFDQVFLCLDPDAREKVGGISAIQRVVDILGREKTKVMLLPGKVDDMIIKNGLSLLSAMRYAK